MEMLFVLFMWTALLIPLVPLFLLKEKIDHWMWEWSSNWMDSVFTIWYWGCVTVIYISIVVWYVGDL